MLITTVVNWRMVRSVAAAQRGHPESKSEKRRRLRSLGILAGLVYGCGLLVRGLPLGDGSGFRKSIPPPPLGRYKTASQVTSVAPLWLFGSNDNSDWSRPEMVTR